MGEKQGKISGQAKSVASGAPGFAGAGVDREGFEVFSLAFLEDRIVGEGGFPGA